MKYFNQNYFFQNIKKSKSILALFLGIIPIFSIIIFLLISSSGNLSSITLNTISALHYVGIYIIPLILSTCLFGFIYKKRSVDFINSMPLSRKTIFITNTIAGIILILSMIILSAFSIYIASTFTEIIIPFRMIVDYILIWSISYIFVFILSNIAMSLAGNVITQIIVTMLLLFLVPLSIDYFYVIPHDIIHQTDNFCLITENKEDDACYYNATGIESNYTSPYNNVRSTLTDSVNPLNYISIIKMAIISVVGSIIGLQIFKRRKMEDNETSFKDLRVHNFVKGLTMFPFIALISAALPSIGFNTGLILILGLLLVYFFIYDLITKKSISKVGKNLTHFAIIVIVLFGLCIAANTYNDKADFSDAYVNTNDITSIDIAPGYNNKLTEFNKVNINNKETINLILDSVVSNYYDYSGKTISKNIKIYTNSDSYLVYFELDSDSYDKIIDQIDEAKKKQTNKSTIETDAIYAVSYQVSMETINTGNDKIIKAAKEALKQEVICDNYNHIITTSVYAYVDGKVVSQEIPICESKELKDFLIESINNKNKELIEVIGNISYTIAQQNNFHLGFDNQISYNDPSEESVLNITSLPEKEIYNFIKKYKEDKFDINKPFISLYVNYQNRSYTFLSNRVDEFKEIIKEVIEKSKEENAYDND